MNSKFEPFSHFASIRSNLVRDIKLAENLLTPNEEDTLEVKAAIVGFCYHSSAEKWDRWHFDFLREHGADAEDINHGQYIFSYIGIGYILGLYESGKISKDELLIGEIALPGFVLLDAERFTLKELPRGDKQ